MTAPLANLTEIHRTEDYTFYRLAPMEYGGAEFQIEAEVWKGGNLEILIGGLRAFDHLESPVFKVRLEQHFAKVGIILANITDREAGAQGKYEILMSADYVLIEGIIKVDDKQDLCGDCSPRFEAILCQSRAVMVWLHTGAKDKPDVWALSYVFNEEPGWLQDNTFEMGADIAELEFATFEDAFKAVSAITMLTSKQKGFDTI